MLKTQDVRRWTPEIPYFRSMRFSRFLRDYFDMNRRERRGVFLMLGILLLVLMGRYTAVYWVPGQAVAFDLLPQSIPGGAPMADTSAGMAGVLPGRMQTDRQLFPFDPNTAGKDTLLKLGLPGKVVSNILKYRQKGGQFRRQEDFQKIYGLDENLYAELKPYLRMEGMGNTGGKKASSAASVVIDLNTADSVQLLAVDGIGPVFAGRIIRYRKALGGYHSREQLKEVYGIGEEQYKRIANQLKAGKAGLQKININTTDVSALSRHPYLTYKQAQVIIRYREQHGVLTSTKDLLKIKILNKDLVARLEPYLAF